MIKKLKKIVGLILLSSFSCYGCDLKAEMSLEEKVGQLLMLQFHGEVANDEARTLIQEIKVGGIIYYNWSNGLHSPEQVQTLSLGLQNLALENRIPLPLFIATDQEGGVVTRLKWNFFAKIEEGFTLPGNKTVGETGQPEVAQAIALLIGLELRSVGINMNLAPVVDVNSNPHSPVIGSRSFGNDPEKVAAFGLEALFGYQGAKVIATLKHFPGHGDVQVDSHLDLPVVNKTLEELEQTELLPFKRLAFSAEAIMTAHLLVPALDEENCSTLSAKTLSYLRNKLGFDGVIITDSLLMEGVLKQAGSVDEAAIRALIAGCDILLVGGRVLLGDNVKRELNTADIQRIHRSLISAVKNGRISEERLNEAIDRILKLKERYLFSGLGSVGF